MGVTKLWMLQAFPPVSAWWPWEGGGANMGSLSHPTSGPRFPQESPSIFT